MKLSKTGLELIQHFEGFHVSIDDGAACRAYKDPGSASGLPYTIGWGSTKYRTSGLAKYGRQTVKLSDTLTRAEAEAELQAEVAVVEAAVNKMTKGLNQNQFDAAVSLFYNTGTGTRQAQRLRAGDFAGFRKMLLAYTKGGNGEVLPGLVRRRKAEAELWDKPMEGDKPMTNILKLERTGKIEPRGCEELLLTIPGTDYKWIVRSGQPWAQVFQHGGPENRPGSMMPLPGGKWSVGPIEFAGGKDNWSTVWGPGLGSCWVGVEPMFKTRRGSIGFHVDTGSYGTAGCIGFRNNEEMKAFVEALREHDPKTLEVKW
jgi:GH24 family phage-related lysozyme (muramidase)